MNKPNKSAEEVLEAYRNYVIESITLKPTNVKHRKLNRSQALTQLTTDIEERLEGLKPEKNFTRQKGKWWCLTCESEVFGGICECSYEVETLDTAIKELKAYLNGGK